MKISEIAHTVLVTVTMVVSQFLHWVLSDGQRFVPETGFSNVTKEKLAEGLKQLGND